LFTVILLIGTGWAFLKPFLNDREKKVFMFVIPLQLFANIALIIVGESSPGSQEWVTWVCIVVANLRRITHRLGSFRKTSLPSLI